MLWSGLIEAAITPPGSTLSRPVSPAAPAGCGWDWKYHQGMPFWAQMAAAPGASRRPSCGAIAGRLYAFSATKTTSASATAAVSPVTSGRGIGAERHRRSDELSVLGVRHAKADGIAHRRMRGEHLLDLRRGDVLATADDHLLDPSFEVEVPITQYAAVAGAEPVTEERL